MSFSQQPSEHQPTQPVAPETLSAEENEWEEELADARRRLAAVVDTLETEDDTPVDNLFSAKQQRLLTRALYSCGHRRRRTPLPRRDALSWPMPMSASSSSPISHRWSRTSS